MEAHSGEEADHLAATHAGPIHLLVTDVVMPGMTGVDLVLRLRGSRPGLRAVFMSGYGRRSIAHHGLLEANAMLLEKPFTSEQLLALVRAELDTAAQRTH
jgi:YesN/AraC family two-component response regulator